MPSEIPSRSISPPPVAECDGARSRRSERAQQQRSRFFVSILAPVGFAIGIALFVRLTLLQFYAVPSDSMLPTLRSGDRIAVIPYTSWTLPRLPERGDVIVFRRGGAVLVKRIVAIPGERVTVEGALTTEATVPPLPAGRYFVAGDNRPVSADSRQWGSIGHTEIIGQVVVVLWSTTADGTNRESRGLASVDFGRFLHFVR